MYIYKSDIDAIREEDMTKIKEQLDIKIKQQKASQSDLNDWNQFKLSVRNYFKGKKEDQFVLLFKKRNFQNLYRLKAYISSF